MRKFFTLVLALTLVFSLGSLGSMTFAADKSVIQISFTTAPDANDPYNVFATEIARLVAERGDGSLEIQVFGSGQLGQERELLEGMQMGMADMSIITNAYLSMFVNEAGLFDLPFLFPDKETAYRIIDGPVGQSVIDACKGSGLKLLAIGEGGFRHLVTMSTPVRKPADFVGLKLRCMETQTYLDTYKAMGANAVPMAWAETITGLQQKTIEGLDIPISVIYANGFPQIASYLCMTGHFYSPILAIVSEQKFNSLTPEQQKLLQECAVEASKLNRAHNAEVENKLLAEMEAAGMNIIRDIDYAAFQEVLATFYDEQKPTIGASYVDALMSELK